MRFVLSTVALVVVGAFAPACTLITDVDRSKIEDPMANPGGGATRDGGETSAGPDPSSSTGDQTSTSAPLPVEAGTADADDAGADAAPTDVADGGDAGETETVSPEAGPVSETSSETSTA